MHIKWFRSSHYVKTWGAKPNFIAPSTCLLTLNLLTTLLDCFSAYIYWRVFNDLQEVEWKDPANVLKTTILWKLAWNLIKIFHSFPSHSPKILLVLYVFVCITSNGPFSIVLYILHYLSQVFRLPSPCAV